MSGSSFTRTSGCPLGPGGRSDSSEPPPSGLRGWIQTELLKFKSAWKHPESGAVRWMRRAWDWLHSWTHPDEAMLARLWTARTIDLYHPAARPADEVRASGRTTLPAMVAPSGLDVLQRIDRPLCRR